MPDKSVCDRKNAKKKKETVIQSSPSVWDFLDHWVVLQLLAVFSISFAVGILFMHGTILWHQYKYGYGYFGSSPVPYEDFMQGITLDRIPDIKNDIYEWSHGRLKVNTSFYIR